MNELTVAAVAKNTYHVEVIRDGQLLFQDTIENLIPKEGLDEILTQYYKGDGYTAAFYVGLKGTGTETADDTMASHASWSELTSYDEAARPALTLGTVSGQSVDNSSNKAAFTLNDTLVIAGAFISTSATKGGTAGVLAGVGDFSSGSRTLRAGDIVRVTTTFTQASG